MGKISSFTNKAVLEKQLWLDSILSRGAFLQPKRLFESFEFKLNTLVNHIENSYSLIIKNSEIRLKRSETALEALSPKKVMERGYSVVYKNGKPVISSTELEIGDELKAGFANGRAEVKVLKILSE